MKLIIVFLFSVIRFVKILILQVSNFFSVLKESNKPVITYWLFSRVHFTHCSLSIVTFFFCRFITSYGPEDFPVSLKLRQQMYVQGRVDSNDRKLSIMVGKCFATPTPDENNLKRHDLISDG